MVRANYADKDTTANILTLSFNDNKSVNYIIMQDEKRERRLQNLMQYAFDVCFMFGNVFITEDRKGCALVIFPDKKKTNLKSVWLDLKLILSSTGLRNIKKALKRESEIKKLQPKEPVYYLWFIGVLPDEQNKGIGSTLLSGLIEDAHSQNRTVCLETSTPKNIPWYKKFGFEIYNELDIGYRLLFLKNKE